MRVQWALACREVALSPDGLAELQGVQVDSFFVESVPVELTLVVLARVACHQVECGEPSHVVANLLGPAMTPLVSLEFDLTLGDPNPLHPEGWEVTTLVPIVVRFTADDEGPHGLEIQIDGKTQRDVVWMFVRVGGAPDQPAH